MKKLSLSSLLLLAPTLFGANILYVDPVTQNVSTGNTFDISIRVDSVTDLGGYQFDLFYNPALVSLNTIVTGTILDPIGQFFVPGTDDTLGTISATGSSGFLGGVSDTNGLLAIFRFNALAAGTATFSVDNILLVDSLVNQMTPGTPSAGDAVISNPVAAVPEPGTILLSAGAFAGLWLLRRRSA